MKEGEKRYTGNLNTKILDHIKLEYFESLENYIKMIK